MSNSHIIYLWLRDSIVAVMLFLVACGVAGVLNSLVPLEYPNFYPLWFAIGMFPFYWFCVWRQAFAPASRNDVIALTLLIISSAFIPQSVFEIHPLLFALTLYLLSLLAWQIRRFLPSSSR